MFPTPQPTAQPLPQLFARGLGRSRSTILPGAALVAEPEYVEEMMVNHMVSHMAFSGAHSSLLWLVIWLVMWFVLVLVVSHTVND